MKFSFTTLTLLFFIVSVNSYAANTNLIKESEKKISNTKYDFNVFKLFTLNEAKIPAYSLQITIPTH